MNLITQLESLGYSFTLEGDKLHYTHTGQAPDPATAGPLLAELKQHKSEAIRFLQERIPAADSPLSPIEPGYPITIRWPDGCEERYYNAGMLRYAVHTRFMIQECLALGGVSSAAGGMT